MGVESGPESGPHKGISPSPKKISPKSRNLSLSSSHSDTDIDVATNPVNLVNPVRAAVANTSKMPSETESGLENGTEAGTGTGSEDMTWMLSKHRRYSFPITYPLYQRKRLANEKSDMRSKMGKIPLLQKPESEPESGETMTLSSQQKGDEQTEAANLSISAPTSEVSKAVEMKSYYAHQKTVMVPLVTHAGASIGNSRDDVESGHLGKDELIASWLSSVPKAGSHSSTIKDVFYPHASSSVPQVAEDANRPGGSKKHMTPKEPGYRKKTKKPENRSGPGPGPTSLVSSIPNSNSQGVDLVSAGFVHENDIRDIMIPVMGAIAFLSADEHPSLTKEQSIRGVRSSLVEVGNHIYYVISQAQITDPVQATQGKLNLWTFVSKFTKFDAVQLLQLYIGSVKEDIWAGHV